MPGRQTREPVMVDTMRPISLVLLPMILAVTEDTCPRSRRLQHPSAIFCVRTTCSHNISNDDTRWRLKTLSVTNLRD